MSIQLYSLELEVRALRAITDGAEEVSSKLVASLDVGHFSRCGACYRRILAFVKAGKPIPTAATLAEDTVLDSDSRDYFCDTVETVLEHEVPAVIESLTRYRNVRILHDAFRDSAPDLEDSKVEDVMKRMEDALMQVRSARDESCMHHFGVGSNVERIIDDILSDQPPDLIKTGWTEFDDRSGGWRRGNLVILAAATSSGKSVAALQLAINQYRMGHSVCLLSLEMDEEEVAERLLSNIAYLEYSKVRLRALTLNQRTKLLKSYREFEELGIKGNHRFTIMCPKAGVSMTELVGFIRPMGYDVVYVDYLNLLSDIEGDEKQWQGLSNACREAKIAASTLNTVMVLATQYDADKGKIRYSGGIKEHANFVWTWARTEETIKTKLIDINQDKARNSVAFPFTLREDFEHMMLESYTLTPEQEAISRKLAEGKVAPENIPKPKKGKTEPKQKLTYRFE